MIQIQNLSKTFSTSGGNVDALKDVNITINDGDIFGIIGMSGAGKSTLVRTINMLERPTEGSILIDDVDMASLSDKQLREKRRDITMIFQGFNLLMQRNCLKNVCFPLELAGTPKAEAKKRAQELLDLVGLGNKAKAFPAQLSGGQQQRVAIARALATNPKVLLCDEATSALDPKTTNSILDLIREINEKLKITVVVITHQMSVVESICNRVAILENGVVVEQGLVSDIFARPKSEAAKRLVFPELAQIEAENEVIEDTAAELPAVPLSNAKNIIRVVFNGTNTANQPLVAELAIQKGIKANIAHASTKSIGDVAYGTMLLSFESAEDKNEAIKFLTETGHVLAEDF